MGRYQPTLGTLGYLLSKDGTEVLLIHRNKKDGDDHTGKYNGLGGKVHSNEDIYTSMKREIKEEAGVDVVEMELRGTMNWPGFGPKSEDWLGFIFLITKYEEEVFTSCEEGDLHWVKIDQIPNLPMWEGDEKFLPYVFAQNTPIFHGIMDYDNETLLSHSFA